MSILVVLQRSSRPMWPMKRSGDPDITKYWSDWQTKNLFCQSSCPIVPDDAAILDVWLSKYAYLFQYFYVGPPKICVDHPTYQLGGTLGDPEFFVSCNTDTCVLGDQASPWLVVWTTISESVYQLKICKIANNKHQINGTSWALFQYKDHLSGYMHKDSHDKDRTVSRTTYHGDRYPVSSVYTGCEVVAWYW